MGHTIAWTDEMVQMLRELAEGPLSASEMAAKLEARFGEPFTRNSVIGKAHRMNISFGKSKAQKIEVKKTVKVKEEKTKIFNKPPKNKPVKKIKFVVPKSSVMHKFSNPAALSLELLYLKEGQCRYPLGDVETNNIRFCAAPVNNFKNSSYCSYCYPIVYMPIRKYREMTAKKPQQPSKDI
jgi:hypothetical protein